MTGKAENDEDYEDNDDDKVNVQGTGTFHGWWFNNSGENKGIGTDVSNAIHTTINKNHSGQNTTGIGADVSNTAHSTVDLYK